MPAGPAYRARVRTRMICTSCHSENAADNETCAGCGRALPPRSLAPGVVIASRYEILAPLGAGGMGMVVRAHDRALDEVVALKVLRARGSRHPELARRFRSEIKLAWKVRHRNVCGIHEYGEDGDLLYISMELVQGKDLRQILLERGALPWEEAYDVVLQSAAGLAAIHEAGVIHRDLKPANITRDAHGVVRLMDFGIAKLWAEEGVRRETATGQVVGSAEYMSPEQVRGSPLDFRSDLYSLGIVVYEVFTGRVPFQADTPMAAMLRRLEEDPVLEGPPAAQIPAALVPVLRRSLARAAADRYADCGELIAALQSARSALSEETTDEMPGAQPPQPAPAAEPQPRPPSTEARFLVPRLVQALGNADPGVRLGAAQALGRVGAGAREAVPGLVRALADSGWDVRVEAARALGLVGADTEAARIALREAQNDTDPRVCAVASAASARLGEPLPAAPGEAGGAETRDASGPRFATAAVGVLLLILLLLWLVTC